jgi:hypothetical protein
MGTMVRNAVMGETIAAHRIAGASRRPAGMASCRSLRRLSSARAPTNHARLWKGASAATAATLRVAAELVLHARVCVVACVCVCQTYIAAVADARYQLILFFEESYGLHFSTNLTILTLYREL